MTHALVSLHFFFILFVRRDTVENLYVGESQEAAWVPDRG